MLHRPRISFRSSEIIFSRLMSGRVQDLEELRLPFRFFFQRYFDERDDEQYKEC